MKARVRRFFTPAGMVPEARRLGSLPGGREAYRSVLGIAMPAIAEMVLISLIGSLDTIMVGQLGKNALAAVSLPSQPRMMMLALFFALNIGVTAIVARRKGQGLQEEANRTLRNALLLSFALSVVVGLLAVFFAEPLMRLAGGHDRTPDDLAVLLGATDYFRIMAWALPVNALSMCISAALRGVGETRTPMRVNILANLVNAAFNYLLIYGHLGFPRLEIRGAAIASVIGLVAGLVMSLRAVLREDDSYLRIRLRDNWRLDRDTMAAILKVGGNAAVEQASMRIGFFLYSRIIYSLGVAMFAAHNIAMQFLALTFTAADGLAVAATTLVGQNLGKKRQDLSLLYGKITQRIALLMSLALGLFTVAVRYPLGSLFINPGTPDAGLVITFAAETLLVVALMQPIQMSAVVLGGCLRGAGDNLYVAAVMMVTVSIIRPVAAYFAIHTLNFGLALTWISSLIDLIFRLYFFQRRFNGSKWALKEV